MIDQRGEMIAVMANAVAEARHMLTVPEQRLVLWLIAQIERDDDALREYTLHVAEFREILGQTENGRLYERMEDACNRLQTRVLELRTGPDEWTKINWMHYVRYMVREGRIALQFHDHLKPVLLELRERFCQIPLRAVFQLRGGYAIRWLEVLHSRRHQGSFFLSAEELRHWLHIEPDELRTSAHLHQRAIDYPRQELDAKAPLTFTAAPRKFGRKIAGWTITVKENKPKPTKAKRARNPCPCGGSRPAGCPRRRPP
ncbi:MAG: RepB family plasmid replication initiator protein [Verrucomicrobiaceae bacterium]|nr:MAG: RepB family plasmid replication initiator protein [Verrucomicrobiaceae bacterium]